MSTKSGVRHLQSFFPVFTIGSHFTGCLLYIGQGGMTTLAREGIGELHVVFYERMNGLSKRTRHSKAVLSPKTTNVTCSDCITSPEKKAKI